MEGYYTLDPEKWRAYLSALIKSMRRGLEDDAIYWGSVLYKYGRTKAAWRRILIHVSEDIGPAEPNLPANIRALYENWKDLGGHDDAVLSYLHAISLMARATKSRIIDHAKIVYCIGHLEDRVVPNYAFDHHGEVGRELGRGVDFFFDIASKLHPLSEEKDPYREKAREIALENERIQKESDESYHAKKDK